ncbi:OmpA family protein [Sphingosinithalassobacter portus]|uniref:OmpA family protein n=1 Tax=Stakelama portus TaxID=2676234 RepID=UPI0011AB3631|nr:OmpA family protein [Sphingosinithalassobacter portus]
MLAIAIGVAPDTASAQGLLGSITRRVQQTVESEVADKAEEEARHVTRCALGASDCRARQDQRDTGDPSNDDRAGAASADDLTSGPSALISIYPGSVEKSRDYQDYTDYSRVIGMDRSRHAEIQVLEGGLTRLLYDNPRGRSTLELIRNYRSALDARGFEVDYEVSNARSWILNIREANGMVAYGTDVRYFTGRLRYGDGTAYVSILVYREANGFGRTNIHILQTNEMDADMVSVDPAAMAAELDRSGAINLKGVFFDTGRYTLRPNSDPQLDAAASLMASQPELVIDVIGHTDNVGSTANNQRLSLQRAEAVRQALIARGVSAERLRAIGMGSDAPIASNATEDGRAQNRRVMLVRRAEGTAR